MRLFRGNRGSLFLPAQFFFAFHAVAQQRALQRTHIFEVDPSDIRVESGGRIGLLFEVHCLKVQDNLMNCQS